MKYTVHRYEELRITIPNIEADSQEEAIAKARAEVLCDWDDFTIAGFDCDFAEQGHGCLVDVVGDEDYANSRLYTEAEVYRIEGKDFKTEKEAP